MIATDLPNLLSSLGFVAVLVALIWWARRTEPHWVAKDGQAFTCKIQRMGINGEAIGRWREARAVIDGDGVRVIKRGLGQPRAPVDHHRLVSEWPEAPRKLAVFVLRDDPFMALRLPVSSRAVPFLREILSRSSG